MFFYIDSSDGELTHEEVPRSLIESIENHDGFEQNNDGKVDSVEFANFHEAMRKMYGMKSAQKPMTWMEYVVMGTATLVFGTAIALTIQSWRKTTSGEASSPSLSAIASGVETYLLDFPVECDEYEDEKDKVTEEQWTELEVTKEKLRPMANEVEKLKNMLEKKSQQLQARGGSNEEMMKEAVALQQKLKTKATEFERLRVPLRNMLIPLKQALMKRALATVPMRVWEAQEDHSLRRMYHNSMVDPATFENFQRCSAEIKNEQQLIMAEAELLEDGWGEKIIHEAHYLDQHINQDRAQSDKIKAQEAARKQKLADEKVRVRAFLFLFLTIDHIVDPLLFSPPYTRSQAKKAKKLKQVAAEHERKKAEEKEAEKLSEKVKRELEEEAKREEDKKKAAKAKGKKK